MHRKKHRVVSRHLVAPDRALGAANAVRSLLLTEKSPCDRARAECLRRTKPLPAWDLCTVELGDGLVRGGTLKGSDGMVYPNFRLAALSENHLTMKRGELMGCISNPLEFTYAVNLLLLV